MARDKSRCEAGLLAALACALLLLPATAARADIFHLISGGQIEGDLLDQDDKFVTLRIGNGQMLLPWSMVSKVEKAPSVLDVYEQRLADLPETAAAHAELAAWCRQANLLRQMRHHYYKALQWDSDHAEARKGLGYEKRDGHWLLPGQEPPAPVTAPAPKAPLNPGIAEGPPAAAEPPKEAALLSASVAVAPHRPVAVLKIEPPRGDALARRDAWRTQLKDLSRQSMTGWTLGDHWQAARRQIVAIRDEAAIEPLVELFGGSAREEFRLMLVDTLGGIGSDKAALQLVRLAALDPADDVGKAASTALSRITYGPAVDSQIARHMRDGDVQAQGRLAPLLADRGGMAQVPALINALVGYRLVTIQYVTTQTQRSWIATGTQRAYIAELRAIVAPGAVAYQPIIGLTNSGALLDVDAMVMPFKRTVLLEERNETVLMVLKQLTAQDFGFDQAAWRRWYQTQH